MSPEIEFKILKEIVSSKHILPTAFCLEYFLNWK